MTKIKIDKIPDVRKWIENIEYSPYYSVARKILDRRKIFEPNIADLFETFHEIATIDNKINQKGKNNE